MPDFAMCVLDDCPFSKCCRRHLDSGTRPDPMQAWSFFIKRGPATDPNNCDGWWPVDPKTTQNTKE